MIQAINHAFLLNNQHGHDQSRIGDFNVTCRDYVLCIRKGFGTNAKIHFFPIQLATGSIKYSSMLLWETALGQSAISSGRDSYLGSLE
jgi:hypothetical protein